MSRTMLQRLVWLFLGLFVASWVIASLGSIVGLEQDGQLGLCLIGLGFLVALWPTVRARNRATGRLVAMRETLFAILFALFLVTAGTMLIDLLTVDIYSMIVMVKSVVLMGIGGYLNLILFYRFAGGRDWLSEGRVPQAPSNGSPCSAG